MSNRYSNGFILASVLMIVMLMAGCAKQSEATGVQQLENNTVKVTGAKLFQGDAARLEPHLGLITGCAEIQYKGDMNAIESSYEIWEKGQIVESHGILTLRIDGEFDGDIGIALEQRLTEQLTHLEDMIMTTSVGEIGGSRSSSVGLVKRFSKDYNYSPFNLQKEFVTSADGEIPVWGLMAQDEDVYSQKDTIEETAKEMDWALVLKIKFTNLEE